MCHVGDISILLSMRYHHMSKFLALDSHFKAFKHNKNNTSVQQEKWRPSEPLSDFQTEELQN